MKQTAHLSPVLDLLTAEELRMEQDRIRKEVDNTVTNAATAWIRKNVSSAIDEIIQEEYFNKTEVCINLADISEKPDIQGKVHSLLREKGYDTRSQHELGMNGNSILKISWGETKTPRD